MKYVKWSIELQAVQGGSKPEGGWPPWHGIRMSEADKVLQAYGYRLDRQKGSHCHYIINASGDVITFNVNFLIISYSTKIGTLPNTNKALIILA